MKNLNLQKASFKHIGGLALIAAFTLGLSGCDDDVRVRSASYGSSYYQPYDYYYYPDSYVYFNISTRDYYYYDRDRWIRNRVLPRHYHLDNRDRVKIRIKTKDQPYLRHNEHRTRYAPRVRSNNDYRNTRRTNTYRSTDRVRTTVKTQDYYYYPRSSVYYNPKTRSYYYPERNKWKEDKRLPNRYKLDNRERVKVKVRSNDRPYIKNNEHRTKYAPTRHTNRTKNTTKVRNNPKVRNNTRSDYQSDKYDMGGIDPRIIQEFEKGGH